MTPQQRIAHAEKAREAWETFFAPMIGNLRDEYTDRLMQVANTELVRDKRADKITALSNALKILSTLEDGIKETIRDGELAKADKLRAEKIEQMTAPKRRLLDMGPR